MLQACLFRSISPPGLCGKTPYPNIAFPIMANDLFPGKFIVGQPLTSLPHSHEQSSLTAQGHHPMERRDDGDQQDEV